jgi:hypothetical protein
VTVPANLATVFTFATTMGGGAPVPNVTAVDEIVAYIQSKPNHTISAPIDDRTVQLDNGPSNIADVN